MAAEADLHTSQTLAPDIPAVWMRKQLLGRSKRDLVFWDLCEKTDLPKGNGKVVQFNRVNRLGLPEAPLEEAVTPEMTQMNIDTVQAVVDQWGAVLGMSDVGLLTIQHPLMQQARDLLSIQYNETIDREVQVVCMGTSSVYFCGNQTARANLTVADTLKSDDLRRMISQLRALGSPEYSDGMFHAVVDPYMEADLNKDNTFQQAAIYQDLKSLHKLVVGKWMGTLFKRSNMIPILSQMAAGDVTEAILLGGNIPAGATAFTGGTTVRTKVTRLATQTKFEEVIDDEKANTDAANFAVRITIAAAAVTGTYKIYASQQGGAAGTCTFQLRVRHRAGVADAIDLVRGGSVSSPAYVVLGTGATAPADCPAGINVHIGYIFAQGAVGAIKLEGLKTYITEAEKASDSDPLAQRRKTGWKSIFKACILDPDRIRRFECASEFN